MDIGTINDKLQLLVSTDTKHITDKRERLYTLLTVIDIPITGSICDYIENIICRERLLPVTLNSITSYCSTGTPGIYLYKGDITNIAVDAIVNAANSAMLGCFNPKHKCIDNVIHSKAGPRLRMECRNIMENNNISRAIITKGHCLPSKFVIHVAGPIYDKNKDQAKTLANCYSDCLTLAFKYRLGSIAFCCISTGLYGYPKDDAASIAIRVAKNWLSSHDNKMDIIFDVFSDEDYNIYHHRL